MAQQRRPAGLAWKRLPNVNETAKVLEPGAPDIVTVEVPSRDPNVKEPENIVYVRLDVLPENIRRQAGWIVAEKTLGRKLTAEDIKIFGALGLRNLDLGEES
jgi:hypothetical protein